MATSIVRGGGAKDATWADQRGSRRLRSGHSWHREFKLATGDGRQTAQARRRIQPHSPSSTPVPLLSSSPALVSTACLSSLLSHGWGRQQRGKARREKRREAAANSNTPTPTIGRRDKENASIDTLHSGDVFFNSVLIGELFPRVVVGLNPRFRWPGRLAANGRPGASASACEHARAHPSSSSSLARECRRWSTAPPWYGPGVRRRRGRCRCPLMGRHFHSDP